MMMASHAALNLQVAFSDARWLSASLEGRWERERREVTRQDRSAVEQAPVGNTDSDEGSTSLVLPIDLIT